MANGTRRIDVRVSEAQFRQLEDYRRRLGVETTSQAMRTAMFLGIERGLTLEESWAQAAFEEGIRKGQKVFMEAASRFAADLDSKSGRGAR